MRLKIMLAVTSAALAFAVTTPAQATIVGFTPDVSLATPYTVTFGSASYTFSAFSSPDLPYATAAISVGGTGQVFGNGFGDAGRPAPLQIGTVIPDQLSLGEFFAPTGAAAINYSLTQSSVALRFTNGSDTFFGYATVRGSTLFSIAYNDVPGGSIAIGDPIAGAPGAVPEPASWAMMIAGFGLVGSVLRQRKSVRVALG